MEPFAPRSLLFVPGTNPERFDKAVAAGADLVCIDLEDAVAPGDKASARLAALDYLKDCSQPVGLRINAINSRFGLEDVQALLAGAPSLHFLMLPKVESVYTIELVADWMPDTVDLVPLVETARGMTRVTDILAHDRVKCAVFGGVDYATDVGCELSWEGLLAPRHTLVTAAAATGVTLLDAPYIDVRNLAGLAEELRLGRRIGIRAKAAIHPAQIQVIHKSLAPTAEEVERARRMVQAFETAGEGAALLDGRLIELPLIEAAKRTLSLARQGS